MKKVLCCLLVLLLALAGATFAQAEDKLLVYADGKFYEHCYYSMMVPSGYTMELPIVTDAEGNPVSVTWKITYQVKGQGNPNSTSFKLVGNNKIKCTWPYGYCEVVATAKSGAKIRISADGYRLATEFHFRETECTVKQGHHLQVDLDMKESGYMLGPITWKVGDESIIAFTEDMPGTGCPTVTGLKPGTTTLTATLLNGTKAQCKITVLDVRLPGDVDESGRVNIGDAETLYWFIAGGPYTINRTNSDVNADGCIDLYDVLLLFQHEAGWDVTLK